MTEHFDRPLTDPEREALYTTAMHVTSQRLRIPLDDAKEQLSAIAQAGQGVLTGDARSVTLDLPPLFRMTVARDVLAFAAMTDNPARVIIERANEGRQP